MATAPLKPQALHNFPLSLKWVSETDSDHARRLLGSRSSRNRRDFATLLSAKPNRWKLRPRKENGEAEETNEGGGGGGGGGGESNCAATAGSERKEKRKIWISLGREEIEEDIFIMTGSKPSRRPAKRPKNLQKLLDGMFPGLWLVGATVDSYRMAEAPVKR